MKKLIYLISILAIVLTAFSCEKEDLTPDPTDGGLITLDELDGSWDFVSYTYDGTTYDCNSDFTGVENISNGFLLFEFNKTTMEVHIDAACNTGEGLNFDFTKNINTIKFDRFGDIWDEVQYIFTVIEYDGTELKLRIDDTPFNYDYLGGTLTLIK